MQPCPDSDNNLFTVQSKKQTRDRGKCKYDHCSDCEVVLQEKLKGSVSSFVVFCGDLPILFNERSGWLFLHNTWLGLSSCCPSCSRACNGHSCGQYLHLFIHFDINAHLNVSVLCWNEYFYDFHLTPGNWRTSTKSSLRYQEPPLAQQSFFSAMDVHSSEVGWWLLGSAERV